MYDELIVNDELNMFLDNEISMLMTEEHSPTIPITKILIFQI